MTEMIDLTGIADKGYIRFSIKAEDNEQNQKVHAAFKEFCSAECDNNYTLGIRKLLEAYEEDAHFAMLWEEFSFLKSTIEGLNARLSVLEGSGKKKDDGAMF